MTKEYIEKVINRLTQNGILTDLYDIASNQDIFVLEIYLRNGSGLYFYEFDTPTILLNDKVSYFKRMIILAHEIAHFALHPDESHQFTLIGDSTSQKEYDANYLACRLLDVIGFWDNDMLCIYEHEMDENDKGFLEIYRAYTERKRYE